MRGPAGSCKALGEMRAIPSCSRAGCWLRLHEGRGLWGIVHDKGLREKWGEGGEVPRDREIRALEMEGGDWRIF